MAVPHFPGADTAAAQLRDALAAGRYVVISHGTADDQPLNVAEAMEHYNQTTAPFQARAYAEVEAYFDGLELIDPGLVHFPLRRPGQPKTWEHPERIAVHGGVGYRR